MTPFLLDGEVAMVAGEVGLRASGQVALTDGESSMSVLPSPLSP